SANVEPATAKKARALLEPAVHWILAQQLPPTAPCCFPDAVARGLRPAPSRLAWCYGDPGVAAALLVAARALKEPALERTALGVALRAAARPAAISGVEDAGLCHGAAGLGHIFHRLWARTHEARFAEAARFWFGRMLAMREPGRGFAGFRAYSADAKGKARW